MTTTLDAAAPEQHEAETGHDYPMPRPDARNATDFCVAVMSIATLSLQASQIALHKAEHAKVLEFAHFELREAMGVVQVLSESEIPAAVFDAASLGVLDQLKMLPKGRDFDALFISAELANHLYLRDLAAGYLHATAHATNVDETTVRHLAMVASAFFKEHIVICKNIAREL